MKAKEKNPLYVVKGDDVEIASNFFDMIVKKLNLEPVVDFFIMIFKMLFEQVQSYAAFVIVKDLFDDFMKRAELFKKFSIV